MNQLNPIFTMRQRVRRLILEGTVIELDDFLRSDSVELQRYTLNWSCVADLIAQCVYEVKFDKFKTAVEFVLEHPEMSQLIGAFLYSAITRYVAYRNTMQEFFEYIVTECPVERSSEGCLHHLRYHCPRCALVDLITQFRLLVPANTKSRRLQLLFIRQGAPVMQRGYRNRLIENLDKIGKDPGGIRQGLLDDLRSVTTMMTLVGAYQRKNKRSLLVKMIPKELIMKMKELLF